MPRERAVFVSGVGVAIPRFRLGTQVLAGAWGRPAKGSAERTVAYHDEDALTLAVEAALEAAGAAS
jgi:3-hydroxy-3-methylglutaryl CoA synthase